MQTFASLALFVILGLAIGPVACLAQDEVAVNPEMVKVEFENEQIRVLRVSIGAQTEPRKLRSALLTNTSGVIR
jgi:hypothetical protein